MARYFFGDKQHQVFPDQNKQEWRMQESLISLKPFQQLAQQQMLDAILFPHQVHGTDGLIITNTNHQTEYQRSFVQDADWLITNVPGLALGILTADCVPLLLHDPVNTVVGAVHAGWRGATNGIIITALQNMKNKFGTDLHRVSVYIGPHARTCCYQVDEPFYNTVLQKQWGKKSWHNSNGLLFFDLYHCCVDQLTSMGISPSQIHSIEICTICTPSYCSYRRDKETAGRNISIISLVSSHAMYS